MTTRRFEVWSDPDVGDWTVSEHFPNGSEDVVADFFPTKADAERHVAELLWLDAMDDWP